MNGRRGTSRCRLALALLYRNARSVFRCRRRLPGKWERRFPTEKPFRSSIEGLRVGVPGQIPRGFFEQTLRSDGKGLPERRPSVLEKSPNRTRRHPAPACENPRPRPRAENRRSRSAVRFFGFGTRRRLGSRKEMNLPSPPETEIQERRSASRDRSSSSRITFPP